MVRRERGREGGREGKSMGVLHAFHRLLDLRQTQSGTGEEGRKEGVREGREP